jgi:hypothetical protein
VFSCGSIAYFGVLSIAFCNKSVVLLAKYNVFGTIFQLSLKQSL